MHANRTLRRIGLSVVLLVAILSQATWTLAGTTGGLSGTVTGDKGAPDRGCLC